MTVQGGQHLLSRCRCPPFLACIVDAVLIAPRLPAALLILRAFLRYMFVGRSGLVNSPPPPLFRILSLSSLAGPERNLSDQPPPAGPGSDAAESPDAAAADMVKLDASLTGDVKDKDDGTTTAAAAAPDANGEGQEEGEAGTGATVGGDADGRGASADGAEGTSPLKREFPAMVLPGAAVVAAGQESGPLPSQWYNLRTEYGEGCLFLLTLQVSLFVRLGYAAGPVRFVGECLLLLRVCNGAGGFGYNIVSRWNSVVATVY